MLQDFKDGVIASLQYRTILSTLRTYPRVSQILTEMIFLNLGIFYFHIVLTQSYFSLVQYFLPDFPGYISFLNVLYQIFWITPLLFINYFLNCRSFTQLAEDLSYHLQKRRISRSILILVSEEIYRTLLIWAFRLQMIFCSYLPYVHLLTDFIFSSLLLSLYCVDHRWSLEKIPFLQRLKCFEKNWIFFLGFGCILNACIYVCPPYLDIVVADLGYALYLINIMTLDRKFSFQNFTQDLFWFRYPYYLTRLTIRHLVKPFYKFCVSLKNPWIWLGLVISSGMILMLWQNKSLQIFSDS